MPVRRHYAHPDNLASIVRKVTWLIVKICRDHISAPGPLWDQNRGVLISNLNTTVRVHEAFLAQYRCVHSSMRHKHLCASGMGVCRHAA